MPFEIHRHSSSHPPPSTSIPDFSQPSKLTNSSIHDTSSQSQTLVQTATWLLDDLTQKLGACPSDYYVIASQPGVHSSDYASGKAAPRLRAKMIPGQDQAVKSRMAVNEVAGVLEASQVRDIVQRNCGAESTVIDAASKYLPPPNCLLSTV